MEQPEVTLTSSSNQAKTMENIKVAVRLRPFTGKEKQRNQRCIVDIEQNTVVLHSPKYPDDPLYLKRFTFDHGYWSHDGFKRDPLGINVPDKSHPNCSKYVGQERVFDDLGKFLLNNTIEGYNSALLAYGQTGSGKSYTVSGYGQNEGILPRFARSLYEKLSKKFSNQEGRYEIHFSMFEIYNEVVRDLLIKSQTDSLGQTRRGLKVREHPKQGFFVENLSSFICADCRDIEQKIGEGQLNKSIAATSMNETSSRGHTIYEFRIRQFQREGGQDHEEILTSSVVQLVDLAGSERMSVHASRTSTLPRETSSRVGPKRNGSPPVTSLSLKNRAGPPASASSNSSLHNMPPLDGQAPSNLATTSRRARQPDSSFMSSVNHQRFKESVSINQSLSALGNCIQVLSQYSQQLDTSTPQSNSIRRPGLKIPYRDSVLTKLLNRCCLSGNSKVVIIATLSPVGSSYDDTLSTLRFADRAKQITTHAVVNLMNRHELVDSLHKENERLKQIIDGRVTRSDDSSQTSNFDESESMIENMRGYRVSRALPVSIAEAVASPVRNRTTTRRAKRSSKQVRQSSPAGLVESSLLSKTTAKVSHSSNPSLAIKNQMRTLVSPASKKMKEQPGQDRVIPKSKSYAQGLQTIDKRARPLFDDEDDPADEEVLDDIYINDYADDDDGLITPDTEEDSLSALADEELSTDEKINMFNKLLSNSTVANRSRRPRAETRNAEDPTSKRMVRPRKADASQAGIKQVYILSSSLKRTNPYLSNLNQDEQLTGMISYIIRVGETIVGKDSGCDIVLHGPELRYKHAKITRVLDTSLERKTAGGGESDTIRPSVVYVEPIEDEVKPFTGTEGIALKVNGNVVREKTQLNHCDRVLFGTNSYFVFTDTVAARQSSQSTVADKDLVTFDMARNEVLRKVMTETSNEAVIQEIKDYTHRPGTGKLRIKVGQPDEYSSSGGNLGTGSSKLKRNLTIDEPLELSAENVPELEGSKIGTADPKGHGETESPDALYKDQLMHDTYEFALPVAEMNAVAREMDIKVDYELKILTGEEQLQEQNNYGALDSNLSDRLSSSSLGEGSQGRGRSAELLTSSRESDNTVTRLDKIDQLDIAPALYIKVQLSEYNLAFYWSKEKFIDRRYKVLELYGAWDNGGKSGLVEHLIERSKVEGDYLFDPFIDDPSLTLTLIGHAQITLKPLLHLMEVNQNFDVLDLDDNIIGSLHIQATPCHITEDQSDFVGPFELFSEEDLSSKLLENPEEQLGKKLAFVIKILSCQDLPNLYSHVFCQYTFGSESSSARTKMLRGSSLDSDHYLVDDQAQSELVFNHSHYLYFEKVDQDIMNFLEHGFLTIQVVGLFKIPDGLMGRSPTIVSTIIKSINKYRHRLNQQGSTFSASNYPTSAFYLSNTDSAKSQGAQTNSNSYSGSLVSGSAGTANLFDDQNEDDETSNSINGLSQENIIDMILTKRKLDRAENQLVRQSTR